MTRKGREIPPVQRWLKFSAVGAIGILVQLGSLFVLTAGLALDYLPATALAVEAAVLHFVWHERFTWADRKSLSIGETLGRAAGFNLTTGATSIFGDFNNDENFSGTGASQLFAGQCPIHRRVMGDQFSAG